MRFGGLHSAENPFAWRSRPASAVLRGPCVWARPCQHRPAAAAAHSWRPVPFAPNRTQVRDLVRSLRPGARDANMTPAQACASLSSLFARHPESKQHFLSEGGVLAAMEMLDSDTTKILEPGARATPGLGVCALVGWLVGWVGGWVGGWLNGIGSR
jgi:hypothetical protein